MLLNGAVIVFLIHVVIVLVVAGVTLWAIGRFFPQALPPTRLVVGGFAVIEILLGLLDLFETSVPGVTAP